MKILAIGCHIDDVEIGCLGTLLKYYEKGYEINLAITSSFEYRTGDVNTRIKEQYSAINKIGKINLLLFPESFGTSDIIGNLDLIKPDIIFAHWENDTHQDHRTSSVIAQAVGRKRNITTYFFGGGSTYDFNPNVYSVIDFDKKCDILQCFESQVKCNALNIDIIRTQNRYYGSLISTEKDVYAEGFIVRKMRLEI